MQKKWMIRWAILLVLLPFHALLGQITNRSFGNFNNQSGNPESRGQEDYAGDVDTFGIFSFYAENPNLETPFSDSLLLGNYHQYDPARMGDIDYLTLGNLGSAALPVLFKPTVRQGFDVGLHQYDLYLNRSENLAYHRLEKPFTNLSYMQLGDQSDTYFTGEFSRNFANGLNFSLDYRRISLVGRQNHYPNQDSRNTSITMGMWIQGKNDKYDGFFAFSANTIEQENNGGIAQEPIISNNFFTPNSAVAFLDDAQSRHSHREWTYTHYFKFGGRPDSIKGRTRSYTLGHKIGYINSTYKSFDPFSGEVPTTQDSSFYNQFLVDSRGLRFYVGHRQLVNSFRLNTFKLNNGKSLNKAQSQKDLLEVGITHRLHWLDFESSNSTVNNLFLLGKLGFNPSERLKINTSAHFGVLDNLGDYRLNGQLLLDFRKLGRLEINATSQLFSPTLIQERLSISQRDVWQNDFRKTLETSLSGTYSIPQFKFSVTGTYNLINNYIYFDTLGVATQTSTAINVLQLIVKKNFKVGSFHLDNVVAFQTISEDFVRLPDLYTKHSLYYIGKWFKVLNVRLGADLRYNNAYNAYFYNPLTGQFQLQDEFKVDAFPAIDAFFSMRVTRFRAFVKWENLVNTFQPEELYYQLAYHPHWQGGLRFGIKWRFVN